MHDRQFEAGLVAAALVGALSVVGCANGPKPTDPTVADTDSPAAEQRRDSGLKVEGEFGALDVDVVKETMAQAMPAFDECMDDSRRRLPFAGGSVQVFIRVGAEGEVLTVFLRESTVGDHEAEACIRDVIREQTWPRPEGGEEGVIEQRFTLEPDADVRPPTQWSESELGRGLAIIRPRLVGCRHRARTGPLDVTLYVAPDGHAMGVGLGVADENGNEAVKCVVRAVEAGRFATPGSYPAKVTVRID